MRRLRSRITPLAGVLAISLAALGLAGCTQHNPTASGTSGTVVIANHGTDVAIAKSPQSIISLSPTATEMLYAVGAGKQIKAVDDQSNYPGKAPKTSLSGITPNADAIAGYKPDLVIVQADANGLLHSLSKLDVPVLVEPSAKALDDSYRQIAEIGTATGHTQQAKTVVGSMKTTIDDAVHSASATSKKLSYYYEVDSTYYTATSKTFIGQIFAAFGLVNIADKADSTDSGGYPQLSADYVIHANPDLVFLADTVSGKQSVQTVADRPGWNNMGAVKDQRIVELNDDVASRWGPRVAQLAQQVANAVNHVATA